MGVQTGVQTLSTTGLKMGSVRMDAPNERGLKQR